MDAPISGLFMNHNRLVIQLGHGTPIKNIGLMDQSAGLIKKLYYKLMSTNISYYLSPSEFFAEYIGKAFGVSKEQILIARQPRLDSMSQGRSRFIEDYRKIETLDSYSIARHGAHTATLNCSLFLILIKKRQMQSLLSQILLFS